VRWRSEDDNGTYAQELGGEGDGWSELGFTHLHANSFGLG
jgi:hypothetical protein